MENNPLVTINILSFNRKDELRNTLSKVYEQDYKNIEVIVVDNASSDGSLEMVENEFPGVILIKLEKNIGIAGWNEGFKVAQGEYVLVLDDDSYPDKETIWEGISFMNEQAGCGILGFEISNLKNEYLETEDLDLDDPITFIGCGAIIKKEILIKTKGFSELLFLYEHEVEFSMRVQNLGYKIRLLKKSKIFHSVSEINRKFKVQNSTDIRRQYFVIRNILIIIFLHFPLNKCIFRIIRIILGRLYFAFLDDYFLTAAKAIFDFLAKTPKFYFHREILSAETQKKYKYGGFAGGFFFGKNDVKRLKDQKLIPTKFRVSDL
ncbi:MAG: glycosyltransferase family 2 protein [Ignavibacteriaceae bacterium]